MTACPSTLLANNDQIHHSPFWEVTPLLTSPGARVESGSRRRLVVRLQEEKVIAAASASRHEFGGNNKNDSDSIRSADPRRSGAAGVSGSVRNAVARRGSDSGSVASRSVGVWGLVVVGVDTVQG
ncbi:unnamed protein product [Pleuronectes platessa]|uniref:Uncharacterized protein n=1 Tax=Pleuronectes platessa TaxID=8262 RepID=A0A9N7Z8R6_PLEPL|nr:unnamed protein product [Pleuronectes platessa]